MMNFLRLLRYEWKKNFGKLYVLIIVFIFSFLNIANIYYQYKCNSYFADNNGWKDAYWELYDDFSGQITSEKLEELKRIYVPLAQKAADMTFNREINSDSLTGVNEFSDYLMLDSYFVADMERFCGYAKKAEETALIAAENVDLYNNVGNTYQAKVNVKIYQLFYGRQITEFAYMEGYNRLMEYTFSSWLVLLVCLFAVSGIFAGEKEMQMDRFLKTIQNGYYATVHAKILATLQFSLIVSFWFSIVDYCGFASIYGFAEAGSLPIYALSDFAFSMLNCKLWQYFLLLSISRALGTVFFTLLCSFVSLFFSTSLMPLLLGCIMAGISWLLAEITQNAYSTLWRVCNPAFLLYGKAIYQRTEYINVFGEPIAVPFAVFCGNLILCSVLVTCICNIYCCDGLARGRQRGQV